jgi:hypothetical protein
MKQGKFSVEQIIKILKELVNLVFQSIAFGKRFELNNFRQPVVKVSVFLEFLFC